jgi:hypothetical protein
VTRDILAVILSPALILFTFRIKLTTSEVKGNSQTTAPQKPLSESRLFIHMTSEKLG